MAGLRIRRDDEVVVISGKDRGKSGRVLRVDPAKQPPLPVERVGVQLGVPDQPVGQGEGLRLQHEDQRPRPGPRPGCAGGSGCPSAGRPC